MPDIAQSPPPLTALTPAPGEVALLSRLKPPCCWSQTLDTHDSPVAKQLREDIRARLYAGDTPTAIQASLVAQYGDRIIAAPSDSPLEHVALGLLFAIALAALVLPLYILRSSRESRSATRRGDAARAEHDVYDDRLDEELRSLE
jgi:cytochrome c-type biogenesis protein CcmH